MFVFVMLSCLFLAVLLSSAGNIAWLSCVKGFDVFVTFPYGVPGQVWYLIVSIFFVTMYFYSAREVHKNI